MRKITGLLVLAASLAACSSMGVGVSLPIGGVGVTVGSDGRVGVGVGVGRGGVNVSVGGSVQIPRSPEPGASSASDAQS